MKAKPNNALPCATDLHKKERKVNKGTCLKALVGTSITAQISLDNSDNYSAPLTMFLSTIQTENKLISRH